MNRILVVDDSDLIRDLLREGLSASGFEVLVAQDANEGFAIAVVEHPDLILLDIQLPDVTGFELCRVIRNRTGLEKTPIIIITATANSTSERVRGFQMGADDYVQKPFEMTELVERIRAVLRRKTPAAALPIPEATALEPQMAARPAALNVSSVHGVDSMRSIDSAPATGIFHALFSPSTIPLATPFPSIAMASFIAANALTLAGLSIAAGPMIKPLAALLLVSIGWGLAVSFLVMASSILGIPLGWRDGGKLWAVASIPLLLRLLGGVALSIVTTISPFFFSAGPALFATTPAFWMEGADLSVLWTVWLVAELLKTRSPRDRRRAQGMAFALWLLILLVISAAKKFS